MTTPSPYTTEELMETFKQISAKMKADIRIEFDAGRIAGNQYAEVYLGMLTAALQGASQFYLTKDSAWSQRELHEAEIRRIEAQTLLLGEELLQAKIATTIADETKDEQIRLVENQLEQGVKQLDMLEAQYAMHEAEIKRVESQTLLLSEELLQAKISTDIATGTKDEQIRLVENQLEQGVKQLDMLEAQSKTAAEQLLQAKIQTEIVTGTKDEQIRMVEVGLLQQEDALAASKERHGMNFKPAFSQE